MSFSFRNAPAAYSENKIKPEVKTETVTETIVGENYIILVVKDEYAEDLLDASNLLYIDQKTAESDQLTFEYIVDKNAGNYKILIFGNKLPHSHKYTAVTTAPDCTEQGYTTYTCYCGDTYTGAYVNALGHTNVNDDNYCDVCGYDFALDCSHNCHSSNAFLRFFWKIALFFNKLFNIESKRICECGVAHW